jgi:OOP family OmpA-OmpF porin
MRQSLRSLLFASVICLFSGILNAQENNYIVSKFDFIPGEKVIFFDDFSKESIGDFPALWLTNGSGEIVTSEKFPGRWFHITKMGYFIPEAKENFTENFTIEFDFVPMNNQNSETMLAFSFYLLTGTLGEPGGGGEPGEAGFQVYLDGDILGWKNWSMTTEQRFNGTVTFPFKSNEKYHIAIWVQKQRVRLYANENKVLDVPRAIPTGSKPNIFRFDTRDEAIPLISNFRIAAGLPDMRNRLLNDGKIISYGIQFDVNSDKLKPESYSTLKEISDILKENPAIRIKVVGHTDSDGDEASNLDLSKRRGISVKNELVSKFGVDAARLETDGKGESEPLAANDSPVNKAKNRRVEFINIKEKAATPAAPLNAKAPGTPPSKSTSSVVTGSFKDSRDGKTYKTVKIGTQTWIGENLAFKTGSGCWAYDDKPANVLTYGYLYNWETAKKVCPAGWHTPSYQEWATLNIFLAPDSVAGGKLKEAGAAHWKNSNTGATNETGFTALPGGQRDPDGSYTQMGFAGSWWTTTDYLSTLGGQKPDPSMLEQLKTLAVDFTIFNREDDFKEMNSYLFSNSGNQATGFSVRCIRDN